MEMAQIFTADLVKRAIMSCRNSKAFGPDKLSIFHLKNLGPRAIEYITALFNLSLTTCQIPAIWQISHIQTCLHVVVGPGFVSTLPTFMRSSVTHPVGHMAGLPPNNGKSDPIAGG